MSVQYMRRMAVLGGFALFLAGCAVSVDPGGNGGDPSVTFTVANRTFTLTLGNAGTFTIEPSTRVSNVADVQQQLFESQPTDTPASGSIRLRSTSVQVVDPGSGKVVTAQQAVTGTATLSVLIDVGGAANPCATGIAAGTFSITVADGVVTSVDQSLSLSAAALALVLSNDFSLCLQMEASFSGTISIGGIDFIFGPAIGDNTNGNGNDNIDDNINGNDNTDNGNANDNTDDNGNVNTNDNVQDNTNTNDNTDDNANDNSTDNDNDNTATGDFTPAVILHRGSEQLVAGPDVDPDQSTQTPAGYGVIDIALSGDGRNVWFVLYDEFPNVAGDPYQQLWVVNADGTGGLRSALNDAELRGLLAVATDEDGSVAIADSGFNDSAVLQASPGGAAALLFDTAVLGAGGCARGTIRLTDDGGQFYYRDYCGASFYRADVGAAAPTLIVQAGQILNGAGVAARGIDEFDISSSGSDWLLDTEHLDSAQNNTLFYYLVPGSGTTHSSAFEALPFDTRTIRDVHLTDDGNTFAYCIGGAVLGDVGNCYVQSSGTSTRTTITDGMSALGGMAFADDGSRMYVRTYYQFAGGCAYFQEIAGGERVAGGTQRFADNACPAFLNPQLSDDGRVLASATTRGVYVLHDGTDGLSGFPSIDGLSFRYDGEESLMVRAEVSAPFGVERVFVLPFYNTGLDPTATIPEDQNPFFDDRSGGGVNWSTTFTQVQPGVWERSISLCGGLGNCKRSFVTSEYRLRVIVVDATGTRTTFQDFTPLP